jgi:hypothetical protein
MNHRPLMLLAIGMVIVVPLLALVGQGSFFMAGMLVAVIIGLLLFRRMDLWWIAGVASIGSNLQLMNTHANIHLLTMLGFGALGFMMFVMTQGRGNMPQSTPRRAALFLLVVVIITASMRGWGLRIFGSATWGGMQYVWVIAGLLFFIYSPRITLNEDRMWNTLRWLCVLGFLPAVTVVLVRYVPAMYWLRQIVGVHATGELDVGAVIGASARWVSLQYPAIWTGLFALLIYDRRFRVTPLVLALGAASFVMLGLSGHRTVVVLLGLTIVIYVFIRRKSVAMGQYMSLVSILLLGLVMVYIFVGYMPLTFQRAFAWLPGIQVEHEAAVSAAGTSGWRIEMWKIMIPIIPQYFWLGRGLSFDLMDAYHAFTLPSDVDRYHFFIATHNYHSGPLWFLVDLGIFGLLAGVAFMFGGILHYKRIFKEMPEGSRWRSMYVVFFCFFAAYSIFFFTVNGGHSFLAHILVIGSILEVITQSVRAEKRASIEQEAPVGQRAHWAKPRCGVIAPWSNGVRRTEWARSPLPRPR